MEGKKGADKAMDERLYFHKGVATDTKQVILSAKAGRNVSVAVARDLGHVMQREHAQIGVLITMTEPTQPMQTEAASAGFYHSDYFGRDYPRLQIQDGCRAAGRQGDRLACHRWRQRHLQERPACEDANRRAARARE
jgi:hypothetical protein